MKSKWMLCLVVVAFLAGWWSVESTSSASSSAVSGIATGDDFLISRANTLRGGAAIAYNDDLDEYLVVWQDVRESILYADIYGQIVSSGGVPRGGNFVIRDESTALLMLPAAAYDTVNQRYLVAWEDNTEKDIEGQLLDKDGVQFGAAFNIAEGTPDDPRATPAVACHPPTTTYVVAYRRGLSGNYDINSKRVSAAGAVFATEYGVSSAVGDQTHPDVSVDPSAGGDFLIVWEDGRTVNSEIYGSLQAASGILGPEFKISPNTTSTNPRHTPAVTFNPSAGTDGEWLVVFERVVSGDSQINGRRVTAAGTTTGSDILPISNDSADQVDPAVTYNAGNNEYLVVWEDYRNGAFQDIYGRRVDAAGTPLGSNAYFIFSGDGTQFDPVVSASPLVPGYLAIFTNLTTGSLEDISGQRVSTSDTLVRHPFPVSAPLGEQMASVVAFNGTNNEFLVVWQDNRAGNWDIYGQRVDLDGTLRDENFVICSDPNGQYSPAVAYNSATNKYLVVWDDRRTDGDIYGQRVNGGTGTLDGGNIAIADLGATHRLSPRVVFNSVPDPDEFFVVYTYETEADNIRGQRLNADGTPLAAEIDIAVGANEQDSPDVAVRDIFTGGSYLIIWREVVGGQGDIKARRLSATGTWLGSHDICTEAHSQFFPHAAYSPQSDRYLVTWGDDRNVATQGRNVYGRQLSGAGTLYAEFAISTALGDQLHAVAGYSLALATYTVAWDDVRATTFPELFGQRISSTGSLVDTNQLLFASTGEQEFPGVAWGAGSAQGLLVWQDGRAGLFRIYGRRLTGNTIFLPLLQK